MAPKRREDLNPDVLHYQLVFTNDILHADAMDGIGAFIGGRQIRQYFREQSFA